MFNITAVRAKAPQIFVVVHNNNRQGSCVWLLTRAFFLFMCKDKHNIYIDRPAHNMNIIRQDLNCVLFSFLYECHKYIVRFSMSATRGSLRMFVKPYETHNFFFVFLFQRFFLCFKCYLYGEEWVRQSASGWEVRARWSDGILYISELYGSGHECASEEALLYDLQTLWWISFKGEKNSTYTTRCYNIFQLVIDIWWNFQHLIVRRRNILVCLVISRSGIVLRLLMRAHRVAGVRQKFTQKFAEIFKLRLSSSTRNIINIQWLFLWLFTFFSFSFLLMPLSCAYILPHTHIQCSLLYFFFLLRKNIKLFFSLCDFFF